MGFFDNKNDKIKAQEFIMIRDKKDRPNGIKFDKSDVLMTTAILAGIAKILTAIFSKDKK